MTERPFPSLRNRSTIDKLDRLLGCPAPKALVESLEQFHQYLISTPDIELWDLVCFELIKEPFRYYQTPPEVIPFAAMGVDGVHFGWVDRAPELGGDDFPVARVSPMDSDAVTEVAETIGRAFLLEMSFWAENDGPEHAGDVERVNTAAHAMGLELVPNASQNVYGPDGNGRPVSVTVPDGYRFVQTADNVGVLAPSDAFQLKEEVDLIETAQWPVEHVARLAADIVDRFPATALLHSKCLWWRMEPPELWAETMKRSYRAMDRPRQASNVDAML